MAAEIPIEMPNYAAYLDEEVEQKPRKKTRAEKKAERRERRIKQQIEDKKTLLTDHFRRELELSRKSAKRGLEAWTGICKDIKMVELREELEEWTGKSVELMERKDAMILSMLADINNTQETHRRQFANQQRILDYLLGTYRTLLDGARLNYETQTQQALEDFHDELQRRERRDEEVRTHCESIMHATNLAAEHEFHKDFEIYEYRKYAVVNTEIVKRYQLRDAIVEKMKELRKQLVTFVNTLRDTLDTTKFDRIRVLMHKQRIFAAETAKLNLAEFRVTRKYNELQNELLRIETSSTRKMNDLKMEQAYFKEMLNAIKETIMEDRAYTGVKMRILANVSYKSMKYVAHIEKKGELLLSLAANCRKLQTESEKVLPWGSFRDVLTLQPTDRDRHEYGDGNVLHLTSLNLGKTVDMTDEELGKQMKLMNTFWRRCALVESENLALERQKDRLKNENQKFINIIKSMSKTDNVDELKDSLDVKSVYPENPPCSFQTMFLCALKMQASVKDVDN